MAFTPIAWATLFVLICASEARSIDPMTNKTLCEGDLLNCRASTVRIATDRNAVPHDSMRWPGGEIPYQYNDDFSPEVLSLIEKAMAHISSQTCITFVPRTNQRDYVYIADGDGCYSHWGRVGGAQALSLGGGCHNLGTAVHELMHAVGFEHEHNREDRDDFLTINWHNIEEGYEGAFDALLPQEERLLGDFDFSSVMLYGSHAFSKEPSLVTMLAIDGATLEEVKDKNGLSPDDIQRIRILYECQ